MRELDEVILNNDGKEVLLGIMSEAVPGIDEEIQQAHIRLTIEEALKVVDDLKRQIRFALEKR